MFECWGVRDLGILRFLFLVLLGFLFGVLYMNKGWCMGGELGVYEVRRGRKLVC